MNSVIEFLNQPIRLNSWGIAATLCWCLLVGPALGIWLGGKIGRRSWR